MEQFPVEINQIRALKARYCRLLDTKQWEDFAQLLAPDVALTFYDTAGTLLTQMSGRAAVMAQLPAFLAPAVTVHQVAHAEIELLSATTARAIWAMEDLVLFPDPTQGPYAAMHGYGYYHETYEKAADQWRITAFRLERLKLDITAEVV